MNETIDVETGEIYSPPAVIEPKPLAVHETKEQGILQTLVRAYEKAGALELTDEEAEKLMAPFADEQVEILPYDGALYIPHIVISDRLNKVLKPGQWALIRRKDWFDQASNTMYAEYIMVIRGCYIGESVGEQKYYPTNDKGERNRNASLSNALEGTAGECLRRIAGKRLSCGSQVWDKNYCETWKAKWAGRASVNGKQQWIKRTVPTEPPKQQAKASVNLPVHDPKSQLPTDPGPPPPANSGDPKAPLDEVQKTWLRLHWKLRQAKVEELGKLLSLEKPWECKQEYWPIMATALHLGTPSEIIVKAWQEESGEDVPTEKIVALVVATMHKLASGRAA